MILICAGSDGNNLKLANELHGIAKSEGLTTEVIDLVAVDLPLFTNGRNKEPIPTALPALIDQFTAAKGYLMVAPEYNGSVPPVLSNALAWLSTKTDNFRDLFSDKPVGIASHSGGGGARVMFAMRLQMSHLGGNVVGRELLTGYSKPLNEDSAKAVLGSLAHMSRQ